MANTGISWVYGCSLQPGAIADCVQSIHTHLVQELGAEPLGKFSAEIACKDKHGARKRGLEDHMRFGQNSEVPFLGEGARVSDKTYPFDRQFFVRRSDTPGVLCVVQCRTVNADGSSNAGACPLEDVIVGGEQTEAELAKRAPFPLRYKAVVEGQLYSWGDLLLRVGACRKGNLHRGAAIEVEYNPCSSLSQGLPFLQALWPTIDPSHKFQPVALPNSSNVQIEQEKDAFSPAACSATLWVELFRGLLA